MVFCLFLAALVVLWRDNPHLDFPRVLYALLSLLAANLAAGVALRGRRGADAVLAAGVIANCCAVTAILAYSGGVHSNLWMLYLMPVYTVCLFLSAREMAWVTTGVLSFIAAVHVFWAPQLDGEVWFELIVKCAVLGSGAAAVWALASRERSSALRLDIERARVGQLAVRMTRQKEFMRGSQSIADVGILSGAIVHDLRTPLTVILGTTEILLDESSGKDDHRPDIERIQRAARHCEEVLGRFMDFFRRQESPAAPCDVRVTLASVLGECGGMLSDAGVRTVGELSESLPPVKACRAHLERVFTNIVWSAAQALAEGGELRFGAETSIAEGAARWVTVRFETRGAVAGEKPADGVPGSELPMGLYLAREIMKKGDGGLSVEDSADGEKVYSVVLPAAQPPRVDSGGPAA